MEKTITLDQLKIGDRYQARLTGLVMLDGAPIFVSYATTYRVCKGKDGKRKLVIFEVGK